MKVNANYYLVGIVSWGYDCNGKTRICFKSKRDFLYECIIFYAFVVTKVPASIQK